jgi:hypothetical protein
MGWVPSSWTEVQWSSMELFPMSALGQKQTFAVQNRMSALPPIATAKADIRPGHVCFTPESGHARCNSSCQRAISGHEIVYLISLSTLVGIRSGVDPQFRG